MLCQMCGLEAGAGSMGGPAICPSCDCGFYRDGSEFSYRDLVTPGQIQRKADMIENPPSFKPFMQFGLTDEPLDEGNENG